MRKTLLLATILFLCAGVAQAQAVYEAFGNAVMAREGGAGEKAGAIVLFLRSGDHNGGIVTVRYSAPLAAGTDGDGKRRNRSRTDVDEGTVTVTMPSSWYRHTDNFRCSSRPARGDSPRHSDVFR